MAQTQPDPFAGRVVIGVDGSEQSHDAVHWGAAYAALLGCEATLLHTWEMPVGSVRGLGYDTRVIEDAREGAQAILDEAARVLHEAQPDLVGHTALVPGGSVHALLGAATTARCLVVGSRGRGALASLLLGSTSDAVAARAECPVIVVPEGARWSDGGSVVLTSDGSPAAEAATRFAFDEAVRRQAHLEVLVTVEEPTAIATDALYFPPDMAKVLAESHDLLDRSLAPVRAEHPDVDVEVEAIEGSLGETVARHSGSAALVVTGSRGRGPTLGLLAGSASRQVVAGARCPVAVVKS